MTILVDASALIAIMRGEPEKDDLERVLEGEEPRLTTAVSIWEASMAAARLMQAEPRVGLAEVERFCVMTGLIVVPIGGQEAAEAVAAQARYGRGSGHRAKLNMGDCFSYACAKTNGARLLYKGSDFIHTDLA